MNTQAVPTRRKWAGATRVRTPMWRRFTAVISLGSLVVIVGVALAFLIAASAFVLLVLLEQAAR